MFYADLYADLVAPALKCNLSTETWQHGEKENINSTCNTQYKVNESNSRFFKVSKSNGRCNGCLEPISRQLL